MGRNTIWGMKGEIIYTTWKVDGSTPISLGLSYPLTMTPFGGLVPSTFQMAYFLRPTQLFSPHVTNPNHPNLVQESSDSSEKKLDLKHQTLNAGSLKMSVEDPMLGKVWIFDFTKCLPSFWDVSRHWNPVGCFFFFFNQKPDIFWHHMYVLNVC